MRLPCSHVFYKKALNDGNLYDEALVDDKFKRKIYFQHHRESMAPTPNTTGNSFTEASIPIQSTVDNTPKNILSTNEKYKKRMLVCQELASGISEYGTDNFKRQFERLKQFTNLIKDRKDFLIVELVDEANNKSIVIPLRIVDGNKAVNKDGEEVEVVAGGSVGEQANIIIKENTDQAQSMN
ncbi:unnamed protein product [Phaedon cochleariae]|uniref:Uncharacterized protein n=1 Tax=Phaedon cochleariae TaxID=80249 RepID=A0A9N9X2P3_PHACE|nr:unnamed protein product [Phaedon cochleariae]